jgi:glycosyltransferase involved in cell wall biosynthesis
MDLEALGFSPGCLRVIENGVPEAKTTQAPLDVRAGLGLGRDDFVAVFVANLRPEKRVALFAEAVISANSRNSRVRGVIAGDGPDLGRVRALAGTTEALRVLGARSEVADLIAAADVVCLTSSAEALPMVILEAMSLGKTVLATDVGGVAEAVVDGKTGVVLPVELGETLSLALCRLAADAEGVAAMGCAARVRYVERYSADRMADEYADVLRETMDNWQHGASKPG